MAIFTDLTGKTFGKLFIGKQLYPNSHGKIMWACVCECGRFCTALSGRLNNGAIKSCGCFQREDAVIRATKHGLVKHPLYHVYRRMFDRCYNPNCETYSYYGGRGIKIEDEWLNFQTFYDDMVSTYDPALSIDRINANGNYSKENCRWATKSIQGYNQNKYKANTSGKTGVNFDKRDGKWYARISVNNKKIFLGGFFDFEKAKEVRLAAELKYFGVNKE